MQHLGNYHRYGRASTAGNLRSESESAALVDAILRKHFGPSSTPAQPGEPEGDDAPLVTKFISQTPPPRNAVKTIHLWPRSAKLERVFTGKKTAPPSVRKEIQSFSAASKRRLKFTAGNAFPSLVSQFAMTYHKRQPTGQEVKKDLNLFLTHLRKRFPDVAYLWVLEFQTRKTPHFHLFLSLPQDTPGLHKFLADRWHQVAEADSADHLWWHHRDENFIAWEMGSGGYLCKYLDKEHQKAVPEGFTGVGRFWGSSRGLVPDPIKIDTATLDAAFGEEDVDPATGECKRGFPASEFIVRQMCRHHEKTLRKSPWRSSARKRPTSYTLPNGATVYQSLENYLSKRLPPF